MKNVTRKGENPCLFITLEDVVKEVLKCLFILVKKFNSVEDKKFLKNTFINTSLFYPLAKD